MEKRAVATSANLIDGGRVEIDEDGSRHVFAAAGLGEEGFVGAWVANVLDVGIGTTVGAEAMLEEVTRNANQLQGSRGGREGEEGGGELTAPKHCYPAGYQPGPDGDEGPNYGCVNIIDRENSLPRSVSSSLVGWTGLAEDELSVKKGASSSPPTSREDV